MKAEKKMVNTPPSPFLSNSWEYLSSDWGLVVGLGVLNKSVFSDQGTFSSQTMKKTSEKVSPGRGGGVVGHWVAECLPIIHWLVVRQAEHKFDETAQPRGHSGAALQHAVQGLFLGGRAFLGMKVGPFVCGYAPTGGHLLHEKTSGTGGGSQLVSSSGKNVGRISFPFAFYWGNHKKKTGSANETQEKVSQNLQEILCFFFKKKRGKHCPNIPWGVCLGGEMGGGLTMTVCRVRPWKFQWSGTQE